MCFRSGPIQWWHWGDDWPATRQVLEAVLEVCQPLLPPGESVHRIIVHWNPNQGKLKLWAGWKHWDYDFNLTFGSYTTCAKWQPRKQITMFLTMTSVCLVKQTNPDVENVFLSVHNSIEKNIYHKYQCLNYFDQKIHPCPHKIHTVDMIKKWSLTLDSREGEDLR